MSPGTWLVVAVGVVGAAVLFWPMGGDPPGVQTSIPPELVPYCRTSVNVVNEPPAEVWPALQRTRQTYEYWFQALAVFSSAYRNVFVQEGVGANSGASGDHVHGRGLDLVERIPGQRGLLRAQCIAARAAGAISFWVDEGDHVHVRTT